MLVPLPRALDYFRSEIYAFEESPDVPHLARKIYAPPRDFRANEEKKGRRGDNNKKIKISQPEREESDTFSTTIESPVDRFG